MASVWYVELQQTCGIDSQFSAKVWYGEVYKVEKSEKDQGVKISLKTVNFFVHIMGCNFLR